MLRLSSMIRVACPRTRMFPQIVSTVGASRIVATSSELAQCLSKVRKHSFDVMRALMMSPGIKPSKVGSRRVGTGKFKYSMMMRSVDSSSKKWAKSMWSRFIPLKTREALRSFSESKEPVSAFANIATMKSSTSTNEGMVYNLVLGRRLAWQWNIKMWQAFKHSMILSYQVLRRRARSESNRRVISDFC